MAASKGLYAVILGAMITIIFLSLRTISNDPGLSGDKQVGPKPDPGKPKDFEWESDSLNFEYSSESSDSNVEDTYFGFGNDVDKEPTSSGNGHDQNGQDQNGQSQDQNGLDQNGQDQNVTPPPVVSGNPDQPSTTPAPPVVSGNPDSGNNIVERATPVPVINKESDEKIKRREYLGAFEQANVALYKNGVLGIYPTSGSEAGGSTVTFLFAIQDEATANVWPEQGFFGGCVIDGQWLPLSNMAIYSPAQVFLLSCIVPPHPPGEVEVAIVIEKVTRYPDNGTVRFTYTSANQVKPPVTELALCTVFQNQELYLREWIAFHTIFGVTKFYLYDQSETKNWKESVQDYINSGLVVVIPWRFNFMKSIRHQAIGLWHSIKTFGEQTKWMGFTDIDEFLFIPKTAGKATLSIVEFLKGFEDVGGVMIDRFTFGPNDHKTRPPGLVIENYTKRSTNKEVDQPVKSIVQPKYVRWAGCGGVHTFALMDGWTNVDGYKRTRENGCGIPYKDTVFDAIRINHYWTKSAQDWAERMQRDSGQYNVPAEEILQKWPYFTDDDTDIIEFAQETKQRMEWGVNLTNLRT